MSEISEVQVKTVAPMFVTKQTLCDMFQISMTYLEDNFLNDNRIKSFKYEKGSKFVRYDYEKSKKYMTEILIELTKGPYKLLSILKKS